MRGGGLEFLNCMWNIGGHCFWPWKPFSVKSDIWIPKCTEKGGSTCLRNIPKKYPKKNIVSLIFGYTKHWAVQKNQNLPISNLQQPKAKRLDWDQILGYQSQNLRSLLSAWNTINYIMMPLFVLILRDVRPQMLLIIRKILDSFCSCP